MPGVSLNLPGQIDAELARRSITGDEDSFALLVKRYQRPLVNFIARMIGDVETALDLSQEVFIKIYCALDRFDPKYRFSTWAYRIAMNVAIDYMRRRSPLTTSLDAAIESDDSSFERQYSQVENSLDQELVNKERSEQIRHVISRLPLRYRQLIVLRYIDDLSYSEIAEATRLPLGTVKNRLFRAHDLVRHSLKRIGIEQV